MNLLGRLDQYFVRSKGQQRGNVLSMMPLWGCQSVS